ncbi:sigma-54 interaction domain-containing protein [Desulfotalea psychrophila]|uniref:HTH-type transcriptional regulatory protein TyrR n=1 Tax=Desulfotalea psychrophila (strain LSv54 / DSM 12343) TaxID=177439 RepID=Q6ARE0_DESPS|nr:sigma 54-interacting transcriptional regulator [Desulfotalea psychrophila]CAG35084.1 probable transcriptional regulator [Desulfotalea psychrophila LSv54]
METINWATTFSSLEKHVAVCTCRGAQWVIERANNNFCEAFKNDKGGLEGQSFLKCCTRLDLFAVAGSLVEASEGFLVPYYHEDQVFALTWFWLDVATKTRSVFAYSMPMQHLGQDAIIEFQELDILFESMHDGVWVIDGDGITLRVNKAMERIAGVRAEDVIGKHVTAAVEMGLTTTCITLKALETKKPQTRFDDYSNGIRCLNTSTPIFDDDGRVWRVIACIRDISELEDLERKLNKAEMEAKLYRDRLRSLETPGEYLGTSLATRQLEKDVQKSANVDAPVLLLGETGTGKTMTATNIHSRSVRRDKPFVTLNCGAIPADLLEAELFGYESGAFSGASEKGKPGMFELADGGILFLDEIGELPLHMQVKILHVLDGSGYRRLGGTKLHMPNVRIVAATNQSLENLIEAGRFREDLYYRLRVIVVNIPPLRERVEDIPLLVAHFLGRANKKYGLYKSMAPEVLDALVAHPWPGNVRELRATIQLLAAMSDSDLIKITDVPGCLCIASNKESVHPLPRQSLKDAVEDLEIRLIGNALLECKSTYKAAKVLGVSQSTVVRKAQRYNITSAHSCEE